MLRFNAFLKVDLVILVLLGERTTHQQAVAGRSGDGRGDDVNLFAAEKPALACVRVQARHRHVWRTARGRQLGRMGLRLLIVRTMQHHFGAEAAAARDFHGGRSGGQHRRGGIVRRVLISRGKPEGLRPMPPTVAANSAVPSGAATGNSSTLEFLLRRMRHKSDFPALSSAVSCIQRVANSETESLNSLANEILKDVALTQKLLRLVNTAQYKRNGQSVATVSRAVALVGLAGIRNLALSLVLVHSFGG